MVDSRRTLHLLVPDPDRRRILVAGRPAALPALTADVATGKTTVAAAVTELGGWLGTPLPIVEIHFDYEGTYDDRPVPVLVVTEGLGSEPPEGTAWHDVTAPLPAADAGIGARLAELFDEWRSGAEPPSLRPRWSRPGWHARATAWLTDRLTEIGRPPTGPIEQVRHWGISALMRAPTAAGAVWFKAVFPPFHHEPAVTRLLAETFGDRVPQVLAIEPDEGWLVTDDLGTASASDGDDAIRAVAARTLVEIQGAMAHRTAELLSMGCPARPIAALPGELAALFDERPRLPGIPDGVDLAALLARVEGAVVGVQSLGVPASLVHGDFHSGNVAAVGGRTVIYDWSDAAIGNPLVDVVTWPGSWLERAAQEAAREDLLAAWSAWVDAAALHAASDDIVTVGAAYQAVSYAAITRNLEPLRRLELADGITGFLKIAMDGARG